MDRRTVASGLAGAAALLIVTAQVAVGVVDYPSWREAVPGIGALIVAVSIPLVGAVLVARRRAEGVAVLATSALIGLPGVASLSYLLVSSPRVNAYLLLQLVAMLSIVAAGVVAWPLREAARWRWDRPVLLPYVALGIVALLPNVAQLVTLHGTFFPIAMLVDLDVWDLTWLAQLMILAGVLAWAARLPRRTAAVVVLVLVLPRLMSSLDLLLNLASFDGLTTEPIVALGLAAEAALIVTACWWLIRGDDRGARTEVVEPGAHVTR